MREDAHDARPLPGRLAEARKAGIFAYTRLGTLGFLWLVLGGCVLTWGPASLEHLAAPFRYTLGSARGPAVDVEALAGQAFRQGAVTIGWILLVGVAAVLTAGGLQTRLALFPQRLGYRAGLRRPSSLRAAELVFSLAVAAGVIAVLAWAIRHQLPLWAPLMGRPLSEQAQYVVQHVGRLCVLVGGTMVVFGAVEWLARQRRIATWLQHHPPRREELRAIEGDPRVEQRQRQLQRQLSRDLIRRPLPNQPRRSHSDSYTRPSTSE